MLPQFQNNHKNLLPRPFAPETGFNITHQRLIRPTVNYSKAIHSPQKNLTPMLDEFMTRKQDSSRFLRKSQLSRDSIHSPKTCYRNLNEPDLMRNLHFKNLKFMKNQKISKNRRLSKLKRVKLPWGNVRQQRRRLETLSTIDEKEEIKFNKFVQDRLSQTLGYVDMYPTKHYFNHLPVNNFVNSPQYLFAPQTRLLDQGIVALTPVNSHLNFTSSLSKRNHQVFQGVDFATQMAPMNPNLFVCKKQNIMQGFNKRKSRITIDFHQPKNPGTQNLEMARRVPLLLETESLTCASDKPQECQSQLTQVTTDTQNIKNSGKNKKIETLGNVSLQKHEFGLSDVLKNSVLKKSTFSDQKNNLMKSVKQLLLLNSYNQKVQVNEENLFLLLNLQIQISSQEFFKISQKVRLRIVAMLFVKYVNRAAFAEVCSSFMEDLDFTNESKLLKFLKR